MHQLVARDAKIFQDLRRRNPAWRDSAEREKIMFGAGEFVFQLRHLLLRAVKNAAEFVGQTKIDSGAGDFRTALELAR